MGEMLYIEAPNLEISLTCTVNGGAGSSVDIEWNKPVRAALSEPQITQSESIDGVFTSNLTLTNVTTFFSGVYFCVSSYSICTSTITSNVTLFIVGPPSITNQTVSPIMTDSGVNVYIFFEFTSLPSHTYVQCSGPNGVIDMNTQSVGFGRVDNDTGFLIRVEINIPSVSYTQGGVYSCMASTLAGNITATTLLLVRPVVEPQEVLAKNGDNVTLMCLVQSFPEPSYVWQNCRDSVHIGALPDSSMCDSVLSESGDSIFANQQLLAFEPVLYGDGGVYRCVVNFSGIWEASSYAILLAGEIENTYYDIFK